MRPRSRHRKHTSYRNSKWFYWLYRDSQPQVPALEVPLPSVHPRDFNPDPKASSRMGVGAQTTILFEKDGAESWEPWRFFAAGAWVLPLFSPPFSSGFDFFLPSSLPIFLSFSSAAWDKTSSPGCQPHPAYGVLGRWALCKPTKHSTTDPHPQLSSLSSLFLPSCFLSTPLSDLR